MIDLPIPILRRSKIIESSEASQAVFLIQSLVSYLIIETSLPVVMFGEVTLDKIPSTVGYPWIALPVGIRLPVPPFHPLISLLQIIRQCLPWLYIELSPGSDNSNKLHIARHCFRTRGKIVDEPITSPRMTSRGRRCPRSCRPCSSGREVEAAMTGGQPASRRVCRRS